MSDRDTLTLKLKLVSFSEEEDIEEGLRTESGGTSSKKVGILKRVLRHDSESGSEVETDSGVEADSETESDLGESDSERESDSKKRNDSEEEESEEDMVSMANSDSWNEYVTRTMLALMQKEQPNFDQSEPSGMKKMFIKYPDVAGRIYLAGKDDYRDDDGMSLSSGDAYSDYHSGREEPGSTTINSDTYFYPTAYEYEVPDRYKEKWFTNPLYRKRVYKRAEHMACYVCDKICCFLDVPVIQAFKDKENQGKEDYFYISKRNQFKL